MLGGFPLRESDVGTKEQTCHSETRVLKTEGLADSGNIDNPPSQVPERCSECSFFISLNQSSFKSAFENLLLSLEVCLYPGQDFTVKPKQSAVGGGHQLFISSLNHPVAMGNFQVLSKMCGDHWVIVVPATRVCQPSQPDQSKGAVRFRWRHRSSQGSPVFTGQRLIKQRLATLSML